MIHRAVLLKEVIDLLAIKHDGIYVDGTIGSGGHSQEILKRLGNQGRIIGIDRDKEALKVAEERLKDSRVDLVRGDFSRMRIILHERGFDQVEGILLDLGVSMMQLKSPERGFSFYSEELLDMRMDQSMPLSAWDVVNRFPAEQLEEILKNYGEESQYRKIARAIVEERKRRTINTCKELAQIIVHVYGRKRKIHPATKTFQGLRIFINNELSSLTDALRESSGLLKKGGRLCVISYHSLEDRVVKKFIREESQKGFLKILTKKPISPSFLEKSENPSSRSAKLRGGEKL